MNVALVSMPWGDFGTPSAALGALSGYLHLTEPNFEIACHSEHVVVSERIGSQIYGLVSNHRLLAESLYLAILFPERHEAVRASFCKIAEDELKDEPDFLADLSCDILFDQLHQQLNDHLKETASSLSRRTNAVGLTTSLSQTFSSLALAQHIKRQSPNVTMVLGGAAVLGTLGLSMLKSFSFVDYVIQGEGEKPLAVLLRTLAEGRNIEPTIPGIITRATGRQPSLLGHRWEASDLNELPIPDYDEYAQKTDQYSIIWNVPIEGSRGCWWDTVARTGNPRNRCYFCNYATGTYREKKVSRVAKEMDFLARRYQNVRFAFCDNAVRSKGITELAAALKKRRKQFCFFSTLRANTLPKEILSLNDAGMVRSECGIEGLSGAYLKRINKGTTVIQNLQVLKTCHELGIWNNTHLITDFPGTSVAEVEETAHTINEFASAYYPSGTVGSFNLCAGSTVDVFRHEYGIHSVTNCHDFRCGLPEHIWSKLELLDRDWLGPDPVDWAPVKKACDEWSTLHETLRNDGRFPFPHPLYYHDGGDFLEIVDRRHGCRTLTLPGHWRSVYLFCMEIQTRSQLDTHFSMAHPTVALNEILERMVTEKIMYKEDQKYLSLAVAITPALAAKRIRKDSRLR